MSSDAQLVAAREYGASSADLSLIEKFKARVADFQAARAELQRLGAHLARTTNDETTLREYGELVARADSIQAKISAATQAIDTALKTARAALGLEGLRQLAGLGVVWFLPVAILGAAIAVIGYWLTDYLKFAKRYGEQQRIAQELVAQGVDPVEAQRQASAVAAAAAPRTFGESVGSIAKFALIAGVGFWLWQRYRG